MSSPRWVYENIERPLIPVITRMERVGFRIDAAALEEAYARNSREYDDVVSNLREMVGDPEFNPRSPVQVCAVLGTNDSTGQTLLGTFLLYT